MGFLRKKTVKGIDYYLWCERKREGKKKGGDGKVKSREITLGKRLCSGEWIPAYAFLGYLPIKQFLENVAAWEFDINIRVYGSCLIDPSSEEISFQFYYYGESKPPKITMRAKRGIDLRTKNWKLARESINSSLWCAWRNCYDFSKEIELAISSLSRAKDYDSRSDGAREGIDDPYNEGARDSYELWLNMAYDAYSDVKKSIDDLLKRTPRKYQEEMKGKLERIIFQR